MFIGYPNNINTKYLHYNLHLYYYVNKGEFMNVVIFLGAGASASENLPTQDEIFLRYFKSLSQEEYFNENNISLINFLKYVFNIDILEYKDNIDHIKFPTFEEVFGILELAQSKDEYFRNLDISSKDKKYSISYIKDIVVNVIIQILIHDNYKCNKYHDILVQNLYKENLLESVSFISCNYDNHIEKAIINLNKQYDINYKINYGVDICSNNSINILKLHGSLNWLYCPICNDINIEHLYDKNKLNIIDYKHKCINCNSDIHPIIIPPTYDKKTNNIFINMVWFKAEKLLLNTDLLIFTGYSFSDADMDIKYLIKKAQLNNKHNFDIYVINDFKGKNEYELQNEENRYSRFLGPKVKFIHKSFQELATDPKKVLYDNNILS